jgi:hypothetical protein
MVSKAPDVLANVSMNKEKEECSYLLFRIIFTFVRGDALTSLDPVSKCSLEFGSISSCQNSFRLSKKLRIGIGMGTSEFTLFP